MAPERVTGSSASPATVAPLTKAATLPTRFYGTGDVDAIRFGRDASKIAAEVIALLSGLKDAEVTVTVDTQATVPGGIDAATARAVAENNRMLKFESHGFEEG